MIGDFYANIALHASSPVVTNLQGQIDSVKTTVTNNWNNTLSSSTKTSLGLASSATPDAAFKELLSRYSNLQTELEKALIIEMRTITGTSGSSYASLTTSTVKTAWFIAGCMNYGSANMSTFWASLNPKTGIILRESNPVAVGNSLGISYSGTTISLAASYMCGPGSCLVIGTP